MYLTETGRKGMMRYVAHDKDHNEISWLVELPVYKGVCRKELAHIIGS